MGGKALRLIRSYLHERRIQVVAGGESSLEEEIFSGVPQGAKWSPKGPPHLGDANGGGTGGSPFQLRR